jgi:DNA-directed RNA polymerase subunit RPC12/RpoP
MDAPTTAFRCAQCGGVLTPDQAQIFLNCPYCGSAVYLDKSRVVFHWSLGCTVTPEAAGANLRRWMAGNQTVKDLDRKASGVTSTFKYFPVWYCRARMPGGKEQIFLEPAAATSISEIKSLTIPAGDLQQYSQALDGEAVVPSVPFPAMQQWLAGRGVQSQQVAEAALVHIPLYVFKYEFGGQTYTAMVEGASGKVFANIYPAKAEAPYLAVAAFSTAGFLCISTFPLAGFFWGESTGLLLGSLACLGAGAVFAVPVFALAALISWRV